MTVQSSKPITVRVPQKGFEGVLLIDFLDRRFAQVGRDVWLDRIARGLVCDAGGNAHRADTPCQPNLVVRYVREVASEETVPGTEEILFVNDQILVACKPHFLPVIPAGRFVNECLVVRLRKSTGNENLVPVHRLDRETAGLVLFSVQPSTRSQYGRLFQWRQVSKRYEAVGRVLPDWHAGQEWSVVSRIEKGDPWFRRANTGGEPNARTRIHLREVRGGFGLFDLEPETGKPHQLRLHMCLIGSQIRNDPWYPVLQPGPKPGFSNPLQLLARELRFCDPVTGQAMRFVSKRSLEWPIAM